MSRIKLLILLAICISEFTHAQPKWVKQSPTDAEYYMGIGKADKSNEKYMDQARDIALSRLASNIAVTISAEANSSVIEQAGIVSETFESNISSFAKAQLEGYEEVDKWENKKEYFVYYRLSKATYKQKMMQKQMIAKKEASQYYKLGQNALKGNNVVTALTFFAKAANAIGSFRGMGLKNINEEMGSFIDVDIFVELNKILTAIQLNCKPTFIKSNRYAANFKTVAIEASLMDENGNMNKFSDLPIIAQIPENTLEYGYIQPTNEMGKTAFNIKKIYTDGNFQVKLLPDIWALAGIDSKTVFFDAFAGLSLPTAVVSVNISAANVFIQSNVTNMGNAATNPITSVKAKQKLTELKWVVTEFDDMADFVLQIDASTRQGAEMQGIYTAFAIGSIALIKNSTGDELFRKELSEINGGGASFELAGTKALENLSASIIIEIENIIKALEKL